VINQLDLGLYVDFINHVIKIFESRLEGVNRRNLKFITFKHTLQARVSVRVKFKSEREGKQIN
jgi:hypothetical protein